jgi:hypothetical protein
VTDFVTVTSIAEFMHDGRLIGVGEAVTMTPIEAAIAARRLKVSLLQPPPRASYATKDIVAAEPVAAIVSLPAPVQRRRRSRKPR